LTGNDRSGRLQQLLDLDYARVGERELLLNVTRPLERGNAPLPCVIYVHGGGWSRGERTDTPNDALAVRGYVTASISYRFSEEAIFPAALHDVKAAVRWVRANEAGLGVDPGRIGIWGHSAGGHLASLAAVTGDLPELEGDVGISGYSSAIQAAVSLAGHSWFPDEALHADRAIERLLGAHQRDVPELAALASPLQHVTADSPPFLIVHGGSDAVVPESQATMLHERLVSAGVSSEVLIAPGAGHSYHDLLVPETVDRIAAFFDACLK
jgi:acetyl esterase/lipase